jgi:hypothetical protein
MGCLNPDDFLPIDKDELIDLLETNEDKTNLKNAYKLYDERNYQFLYAIILIYIAAFLTSTYYISIGTCSASNAATILILYGGATAIIITILRIYFFKHYLQLPIIALFKQYSYNSASKTINILFIILIFCILILSIVVSHFSFIGKFLISFITLIILMTICIITSWLYKQIIRHHIYMAWDAFHKNAHA